MSEDDTKGWRKLRLPAVCDIGGESLEPGTIIRQVPLDQMTQGTHACRDHLQDTDDTRREDEPGDWFIADFNGECSRGGEMFKAGDSLTIRADGDGGWECRQCVIDDYDDEAVAQVMSL